MTEIKLDLDLSEETFDSLYALCAGRDRTTGKRVSRHFRGIGLETAIKAIDAIEAEGRENLACMATEIVKFGLRAGEQRGIRLRSPLINEVLKARDLGDENRAKAYLLLAAATLHVRDAAVVQWAVRRRHSDAAAAIPSGVLTPFQRAVAYHAMANRWDVVLNWLGAERAVRWGTTEGSPAAVIVGRDEVALAVRFTDDSAAVVDQVLRIPGYGPISVPDSVYVRPLLDRR